MQKGLISVVVESKRDNIQSYHHLKLVYTARGYSSYAKTTDVKPDYLARTTRMEDDSVRLEKRGHIIMRSIFELWLMVEVLRCNYYSY